MSMFFLLPGVDSSLSLPKFYSSRKTQSIQTHRLNKLVTNSTTWTSFNISLLRYRAFLLSPHQYHFILFRVGADFVSEITFGMKNTQGVGLLVSHHFCPLNHEESTFHIKLLRKLRRNKRKENFLRHWYIWRNFALKIIWPHSYVIGPKLLMKYVLIW